jgi:hypothetical protein
MVGENGIFLRVFKPGVPYRAESFIHRDSVYVAKKECVFTVVRQEAENQLQSFSELAWLYPEEVRLLSMIALSVPEGQGMVTFLPAERQLLPLDPFTPLHIPAVLEVAERQAKRLLSPKDAHFEVHSWLGYDPEFDIELFEGIDPADDLLIRGLYCLLKSARLMRDLDFAEEAFMNVQIAREASLELIREVLLADGKSNPSFKDAHLYLVENFKAGESLADFFDHEHQQWITTKHPNSDFGPVWIPPLMADDFYETYEALVSVYRHLITDEPGRAALEMEEGEVESG